MIFAGTMPTSLEAAALVAIGFCVGTAGSFFGVGGAFLVTPALNILGFPMVYAIGTDLAHMTGKSVIATLRHRKLGHVDWKAGGLLLFGTFPGVKLGTIAVMALERAGHTESVLRIVYIILLGTMGTLILVESLSSRNKTEAHGTRALLQRRFRIKPFVSLKTSGIESISVWGVILLGLATGFLSSFLGVGGGFIRMPAMIYLLGMPTKVAVGTDLLEVFFSGGYGAFLYAREGRVDLIAALIMLCGASLGSQLGALATKYVEANRIRFYLAVMILGAGAAVAAKQVGATALSAGILLVLGPSLAGGIIYKLVVGVKRERAALKRVIEGESAQ